MQNTPNGFRINVGIFGETNVGKSSLFNAITKTDIAIVSDISGTTTDPVKKAMELIPFGPIVLIDTAGLGDNSALGSERIKKTYKSLMEIDYAIYLTDINNFDLAMYESTVSSFKEKKVKHLLVFTKIDLAEDKKINKLKEQYTEALFINNNIEEDVEKLRVRLVDELSKVKKHTTSFLADILEEQSKVVLVCPIDSEAPKGRLILPQAQIIRDCLDNNFLCNVCTFNTIEKTLEINKDVDLVITDSQLFKEVNEFLPDNIPLTSFSILMARQKAGFDSFIEGTQKIANLKDGAKILMAEVCTHNISHEDIGRVKIPNLLKNKIGENVKFDFAVGKDYPENIADYDLIIHCGGCMINGKEMQNRVDIAMKEGVPIANYGTVIAYCNGILEKAIKPILK